MSKQVRGTSSEDFEGVSVHAGFPNPALDTSLDVLDLNQLLIGHPVGTFFMRISGNDWQDVGIFSNDIAIIDRVVSPRKNDLAIWWEGESFIIGNFAKVPLDTPVWGVVTAVIHQYREKT